MSDTTNFEPGSTDSTLLEGLYQLTVAGHVQAQEFERLAMAVYERLLATYRPDDAEAA